MECVDKICSLALAIYKLCDEVKENRNQCKRLRIRIEVLTESVKTITEQKLTGDFTDIGKVLKELVETLTGTEHYIKRFTEGHKFCKWFNAYKFKDHFEHLNERLNDAAQALGLALQTEQVVQLKSIFKAETRKKEDKEDSEKDARDLDKLMKEMNQEQCQRDHNICQRLQSTNLGVAELKEDVKEIKQLVKSNHQKPSVPVKIKEIKWGDIQMNNKAFLETANSTFYKGTYQKFPVAIKRFIHTNSAEVEEIREIFHKEAETMNYFNSPNIVRFYGICIHQIGDNTVFFIVMEYCDLGSLSYVLQSERPLSWKERVQMSLDAARGLYRLHQTEETNKLHCCLNSTRFLVDKGLVVKLGGLDLARTETSIRRNIHKKQVGRMMPYASPQQLNDINYPYDKACEVYSFGIVLWEIASRKVPFKDITDEALDKKVREEQYREPLPDDCPKDLRELIDECRSFDPIERPTIGAIVDRLANIMQTLNE
ncbi:mixed lineage kinase domain-like protein isoform X2 [Callorhinchus milii]|uniref:mixed lineage kinase domain-like protein isoform X2 n=1 Tax=Callorhinchus milii TaxID=7868 RepID=UPI0004573D98|nr:mixed lineage kinase domain-like protein isoform X2 [Callorhinchus milii]|eukprot:gi/632972861/ref/XP_007902867.1/ PREDICTED: mixed lineage kinase domain-like protein isoform X2 [Callorhinchus milii]